MYGMAQCLVQSLCFHVGKEPTDSQSHSYEVTDISPLIPSCKELGVHEF